MYELLVCDIKGVVRKIFGIVETVEFSSVGHRVVHGGEIFKTAILMTEENIDKLDKIASLAPLHNPVQTEVIKMCRERYLIDNYDPMMLYLVLSGIPALARVLYLTHPSTPPCLHTATCTPSQWTGTPPIISGGTYIIVTV